ncbi:MAG: hypothetical protein IPG17_16675 [Sandaracinaceae bacterium]|jgi:hypothetical protein|nr:hypothetical protein [Sandaracinaceae bacterium]MBK6810685.1 hypothetical protein [Sandaracinaceae bacterium]MBK7774116.1 hypothetical protein [Sandaracinaceae bacterium]MBK8409811.1 hypothetical protein [Sandaracinaceae bacterium]MBK8591720.1 hypothetical protein [Sandaracinaceae bacterium]
MQGLWNSLAAAMLPLALLMSLTVDGGCATSFTGSARVEGGAATCRQKCEADGLYFAGMVHMGEYTNGCICSVDSGAAAVQKAVGGAAAAAVGVVLQMRAGQQSASH